MLKGRTKRMLLATFGSVAMLAGTAGPAMAAKFTAVLTGYNVLAAADRDGWGRVKINVSDTFNELCADIEVRSVGRPTAVQIHRAGPGANGPAVVNLDRPDGDGDEDDCDRIGDSLADDIQLNPGNYYVLVRTAEFPHGAIRGQLVPSAD